MGQVERVLASVFSFESVDNRHPVVMFPSLFPPRGSEEWAIVAEGPVYNEEGTAVGVAKEGETLIGVWRLQIPEDRSCPNCRSRDSANSDDGAFALDWNAHTAHLLMVRGSVSGNSASLSWFFGLGFRRERRRSFSRGRQIARRPRHERLRLLG